jgi:hypothetical protein
MQSTYNTIPRRVRETIVDVDKQWLLYEINAFVALGI